MFGRPFLGICIWLLGSSVVPALAMDCPVSDYDQVEKIVTDAPSCDAAMQLLMACQLGSSGDVAVAMIVIKKCEGDFLASLSDSARRSYQRKVGACGDNSAGQAGTLFQSIRAICAAQVAHTYARAAKAKKQ
jgi:predicted protein tyrosine phosphatase